MDYKTEYIKLYEVDTVNGKEEFYEMCTFAPNPVISGEVARAMRKAFPDIIYECKEFNKNGEVIGTYRPY